MNMPENVTTAVIAAAGLATRMWPASKTVPKELFPLGRVPVIVHLVWEFLEVGVSRIVVVVAAETSSLMRGLFDPKILAPERVANDPLVQRFQQIFEKTEFVFVDQPPRYGNGIPLIAAADWIENAPCIYAFGDDIVFGENVSRGLLNTFAHTRCPVLAAQQVEPSRKSQFGIIECQEDDGIQYVTRLIEKPSADETASTLASFGRYLVTPDLIEMLQKTPPGRDNEVWFVDSVIQRLREGKRVCAFPLTAGKWYTVGDSASYAQAVAAAQSNGSAARNGT
jgi:UTP--glucose-1-phosphate uridylyltransferase